MESMSKNYFVCIYYEEFSTLLKKSSACLYYKGCSLYSQVILLQCKDTFFIFHLTRKLSSRLIHYLYSPCWLLEASPALHWVSDPDSGSASLREWQIRQCKSRIANDRNRRLQFPASRCNICQKIAYTLRARERKQF